MVCDHSNIMIMIWLTHCSVTSHAWRPLLEFLWSQWLIPDKSVCRTREYWMKSKSWSNLNGLSIYFRLAQVCKSAHDPHTKCLSDLLRVRMSTQPNWGMRGPRGAPSVYSEQESNLPGNSEDLHAWSIYRQARMVFLVYRPYNDCFRTWIVTSQTLHLAAQTSQHCLLETSGWESLPCSPFSTIPSMDQGLN